jgi:hypothetical protein
MFDNGKKEHHLIFLLHGYMSSSDDLDRVYSVISARYPEINLVALESIEEINDKGMFELGEMVANE